MGGRRQFDLGMVLVILPWSASIAVTLVRVAFLAADSDRLAAVPASSRPAGNNSVQFRLGYSLMSGPGRR